MTRHPDGVIAAAAEAARDLRHNPDRIEGADVVAHRHVLAGVTAGLIRPVTPADAAAAATAIGHDRVRAHALDVLARGYDTTRDHWDPTAAVGGVAEGVIRALRDLHVIPAPRTPDDDTTTDTTTDATDVDDLDDDTPVCDDCGAPQGTCRCFSDACRRYTDHDLTD